MNCSLRCSDCGHITDVRHLNLFRITVPCPVCGVTNSIALMLLNYYGEAVGKVARTALKRLADEGDNTKKGAQLLDQAEFAIYRAIEAK